jgi:tetratricopeptide (TPR) repeat protein
MITGPQIRKICVCLIFFVAPACFAASSLSLSTAVDSARALFDAGHYADACGTLNTEAANNSSDPEVYFWLTRCEFELREFDAAINHAEHAISLSPNNSEYHHWLGRSYGRKAEHSNWFSSVNLAKKTHAEFQSAVELDAHNLPAQRDLVMFEVRAPGFLGGGEDKAQAQIEKLAAIDPVQADLARKDLFADHKEWSKAEQECKAALAANPKDADEYMEIAEYYDHRDNAGAIREALAVAARNGVSSRRLDYYVGVAAALAGDHYEDGEAALKRYLADVPQRSGQPSPADAHVWLGRLYEKQQRHDAAIVEYHEALKLDPANKAAHEALKHNGE